MGVSTQSSQDESSQKQCNQQKITPPNIAATGKAYSATKIEKVVAGKTQHPTPNAFCFILLACPVGHNKYRVVDAEPNGIIPPPPRRAMGPDRNCRQFNCPVPIAHRGGGSAEVALEAAFSYKKVNTNKFRA